MNDHPIQIHLLCLTKDGMDGSTDAESILAAILKRRYLKDEDVAKYFPNDYSDKKWFVNVSFIVSIKISDKLKWDTVRKSHHTFGELQQEIKEETNNKFKI